MSEKKKIALTFDDGPTIGITDQILDTLEKYGARASFFLIGNRVTPENEYLIKRAMSLGCSIENHTFTHPFLTRLTDAEIVEEVSKTTELITKITNTPPLFFRPPFIDVNEKLYELIDLTFICGRASNDWIPTADADTRFDLIMKAAEDGAIILVHDMPGNTPTVEAVKRVIPALMEQGYEFVNVREIFDKPGKQIDHKVMYSEF